MCVRFPLRDIKWFPAKPQSRKGNLRKFFNAKLARKDGEQLFELVYAEQLCRDQERQSANRYRNEGFDQLDRKCFYGEIVR